MISKFRWYLLLLTGVFVMPLFTQAAVIPDDPGNFITTWNTENPGTSASNQITIPGTGTGYNYEIYWEKVSDPALNGTTSVITTNSYTLTFPESGIYEVQIAGAFPRIFFNNTGDRQKILAVNQWGTIAWTSMQNAFFGCINLRIPATDAPNLAGVTVMSSMFRNASSLNDSLNHWNTATVVNMGFMFNGATSFNQPLDNWNTANVTTLTNMFDSATAFNQPLNTWNTSNVTNMTRVFLFASAFNQPINNWDTSKVTTMESMFRGATAFNQPLNDWDVSNVNSLRFTFQGTAFNQPLDTWDTSKVTNMANLFLGTPFNYPLATWNTASVTTMSAMFLDNTAFNQPINNWDVSNVTFMQLMFSGATAFDQPLDSWDITSVTDMTNMFFGAGLSQSNQDAFFNSLATQATTLNKTNIPFHLGLKQYSQTGATAIDTLRGLNWAITEQYQADYRGGSDAILFGSSSQLFINNGSSTAEVEIIPNDDCTFIDWSDGRTDNPRVDTLTDNLSVIANVACSSGGSSTRVGARRDQTPPTSETLEDTLNKVKALIESPLFSDLDPAKDKDTINQLIALLLELVKTLTLLLTQIEADN